MKHHVLAMSTAILLLAAGSVCAQTSTAPVSQSAAPSTGDAQRPHRDPDCGKVADPARCKEKRAAMREHIAEARAACAGKQGDERHQCVTDSLCAKSADPRKCHEHAKNRAEHRPEALRACAGKRGEEHRDCMREEYRKLAPAKSAK